MDTRDCSVEYREIQGFIGHKVGNDGSVWSCWRRGTGSTMIETWRRLKPGRKNNGVSVTIRRDDGKVVSINLAATVLKAFVGPRPDGMEACHFPDRNPMNCRLDNLRWDTKEANQHDKVLHATIPGGENHWGHKLTNDQVAQIRELGKTMSAPKIAKLFGISRVTALKILQNRSRTESSHAGRGIDKSQIRMIGRTYQTGENHPSSKMTDKQIAELKSLKGTATQKELAVKYGVCTRTIWRLLKSEEGRGN